MCYLLLTYLPTSSFLDRIWDLIVEKNTSLHTHTIQHIYLLFQRKKNIILLGIHFILPSQCFIIPTKTPINT